MVDVEQRRLRTLEHHVPAFGDHPMERERDIGHPRTHPFAGGHDLIEDRLPVERRILDHAVSCADVLAHFVGQRITIAEQVAHANAATPDLVLVSGADPPGRRPDLALTTTRLREHVQLAVVGQDDVRLFTDEQPAVDADAGAAQLVDLGKQRLRVDDHAVADDAGDAGVENAGRNQVENELRALDENRVSRVVAALVTRDG